MRNTIALGVVIAIAAAIGSADAAETTSPPAAPPTVQGTGTLSDKLSTTNGVIHPQGDVDPGIKVMPPSPGPSTMPVIPPPGSPGGNPGVTPK